MIKLLSFLDEQKTWVPVEVELEIWPGLPEIHFLGRPDQNLRESAKRIKSAIRAQGFEFPTGQQILVNLRPSHLKKSSRGVELAIATAFLMESHQIPKIITDSKTFYYGELSLSGEVTAPAELRQARLPSPINLLTGFAETGLPVQYQEIKDLKSLLSPIRREAQIRKVNWQPPENILDLEIKKSWARFAAVMALGKHSVLLAGQAGAGKTTFAQIQHALMSTPTIEEEKELLLQSPNLTWRPLIRPHHTIPMHSLMGGGPQAHGGELARADLGILLLDEFLEFSPHVIEALREPLEQKSMRVSRGAVVQEYPVRAQVIATTNLCPCGDFVPGQKSTKRCHFTLAKCRSYSNKVSGPLFDRFEALQFVSHSSKSEDKISVREIREKLQSVRKRLQAQGRKPGNESIASMKDRTNPFLLKHDWAQREGSERRKVALLRVAQSLCDWEGETQIQSKHFNEAVEWTSHNFEKLKRWDF